MGVIMCKKHGKQFFLEVCEHIHNRVIENRDIVIHKLPLNIFICGNCKENLKTNKLGNHTIEEILKMAESDYLKYESKFVNIYDKINRIAICKECLNEKGFKVK